MNAQDLKNSILQLAVCGKLVEQRAEEGIARELLEQIKLEKDQLIKDKKIKKSKPLPEITEDEIPFEIPESWEWVRLGNIIILQSGQDLQPAFYNSEEKGIPYLTGASNIEDGNIIINRWTESPKAIANQGDLLLTCKGTVGKTTILNLSEVHIARQIMGIRTLGASILYIKLFVESQITYLKSKAKSMIPGIERNNVLDLCIPVPPLEEQNRIVAKIEEILPYIDQYDKAYTKLETFNKKFPEDMKKSILQMAMQGKLVEQRPEEGTADELYEQIVAEKAQRIKEGKIKKEKLLPEITEDEIPFEIPSSWRWVRLGELISYQNGYAYSSKDMSDLQIGYPVIKSGNLMTLQVVINSKTSYIEKPNEKMLESQIKRNDMLMCLSSQSDNPEPLGKTAVYRYDFPALLNQRVLKITAIKLEMVELLYYFINSHYFHYNVSHQGGGSAQANLKLEHVLNMLIPLPPLEEQKRIVAKIEELLPYCDQLIK